MAQVINKNIHESISAIMEEIEAIGKNKKNTQQNFMYRGIDDLYNDLQPKFAKHKVFITSRVLNRQREERPSKSGGVLIWTIMDMEFTFHAADGSSVSSIMTGESMDSGDKGANKAMSIALKYCLFQMFLIPTEDLKNSDPDAHIHELAGQQQTGQRNGPPPANNKKPITKNQPPANPHQKFIDQLAKCDSHDDIQILYDTFKKEIDDSGDLTQLFANRNQFITIRDGAAKCATLDELKKFYNNKKSIIDNRKDLIIVINTRKAEIENAVKAVSQP